MLSALKSKLTYNNIQKIGVVRGVGYTYVGIVTLGGIRGIISGTGKFEDWHCKREKVTIGSDLYDPVINTIRDSGVWGLYALQGGLGSAAIVATAPLSVPYLLNMTKVDENKSENES